MDEFIVMPVHLHGILIFNKPESSVRTDNGNKFGSQSNNLALAIRGYKSGVKSYATKNAINFCWQERFYDRVIRDENELVE